MAGTTTVRRARWCGFISERGRFAVAVAAVLAVGVSGAGEVRAQQPYAASQLACAGFSEAVESELTVEMGGRTRVGRAGRSGILAMRGRSDSGGVRIEAWFDSLHVWRRSPEGELAPDPDGIVGGRFVGRLSPQGRYVALTRPFLPPEVGEIVRLDRVLDDFFPLLPPAPLEPGGSWRDSAGATIRRLDDSLSGGVPLARFSYARPAARAPADPAATDTLTPGLEERGEERGTFVWHPRDGLVRADREITMTSEVPAGRYVRAPVRSRLTQRVRIERVPAAAVCGGGDP